MLDELLAAIRADGQSREVPGRQRADGGVVAGDRGGSPLSAAVEPGTDALTDVFGDADRAAVGRQHLDRQFDLDTDDIGALIAEYQQTGIGPDQFVASQGLAVDQLVQAAFDQLRTELDGDARGVVDAVEADLRSHLDTTQTVTESGISAYHDDAEPGDSGTDGSEVPIDFHDVLHRIGTPLFVLDSDGEILTWNRSLEGLTGVSEADAKQMEMASMAFYPDGRRGKTLADKVLDAPESTDEKYDVPRVEDEEFTLYRDTSVMEDQNGEERHISFSAAPIYEDGELVAVVEMVQDRTEDARRHESVTALVEEIKQTMQAMESGKLGSRATFDHTEYVDDALLDVVESLNEMARQFEELTERVDERTVELAGTIDQTAEAAETVEERVSEQAEALTTAAENVQDVSAGMQQVAATSSQVASAAQRATEAADQGAKANEAVQEVTDGLTETSEDLVESVTDLEEQMDEVSEVVDVIADVAEQTNMLALNANIEAARAGESGSGFAVVADEVKSLAEETGDHAAEISDSIDSIQNQATETAEMVETSHEQVERAESEIQQALAALDEINDAVDEASTGIQEVANANDDQASAVEDITTMIEDAQEHAKEAEAATDEIVAATDQQTAAVDELVDSVDALTDSDN